MNDASIWTKILKIFLIFTLISSITLNFLQNRTIRHQGLVVEHLFEYKKAYMTLTEILGIDEESAKAFLDREKGD